MSRMIHWLLAGIAALLAGCSSTTVESWRIVKDGAADYAYVKPDADFGVYRRLYPEPLEIYYPSDARPDAEKLARIRKIFREAFLAEIGDDYQIVREPGSDVLKVRASLIDLRTNQTIGTVNVPRRLEGAVRRGHLTFLMELIDSESAETLAHAADEEKPNFEMEDDDWAAVEAAAARWAQLFRAFLDEQFGKS